MLVLRQHAEEFSVILVGKRSEKGDFGPAFCTQPPCAKPVWSSSGPPGAWITPSSDWKREPMILRIDGYSALRSLDPGDVYLAHGDRHRLECYRFSRSDKMY